MQGYLTTHILDTARGAPAEGVRISLFRIEVDARGYHVRDDREGRLDVPEPLFAAPRPEAGNFMSCLDADRPILVPTKRPVVARSLVECDRADDPRRST